MLSKKTRNFFIVSALKGLVALGLVAFLPHASVAQEDVYDPFIDFGEFETPTDEEADINFFRHGRFVTLGFLGGQKMMTDNLKKVYKDSPTFGLALSYFFDMRFALQFSFLTSSHTIDVKGPSTSVRGTSKVNSIGVNIKYFLNTQNITRGLATFNPYLVGGFSNVSRQNTVAGQAAFSSSNAPALDLGAGIEFPLMRNKMYFGIQGLYQLVNFKDENTQIVLDEGSEPTGIFPSGDHISLLFSLGINF